MKYEQPSLPFEEPEEALIDPIEEAKRRGEARAELVLTYPELQGLPNPVLPEVDTEAAQPSRAILGSRAITGAHAESLNNEPTPQAKLENPQGYSQAALQRQRDADRAFFSSRNQSKGRRK